MRSAIFFALALAAAHALSVHHHHRHGRERSTSCTANATGCSARGWDLEQATFAVEIASSVPASRVLARRGDIVSISMPPGDFSASISSNPGADLSDRNDLEHLMALVDAGLAMGMNLHKCTSCTLVVGDQEFECSNQLPEIYPSISGGDVVVAVSMVAPWTSPANAPNAVLKLSGTIMIPKQGQAPEYDYILYGVEPDFGAVAKRRRDLLASNPKAKLRSMHSTKMPTGKRQSLRKGSVDDNVPASTVSENGYKIADSCWSSSTDISLEICSVRWGGWNDCPCKCTDCDNWPCDTYTSYSCKSSSSEWCTKHYSGSTSMGEDCTEDDYYVCSNHRCKESSCFAAHSLVHAEDGSVKRLSDLQPGDMIASFDAHSGKRTWTPLLAMVHAGEAKRAPLLSIFHTHSRVPLRVTPTHLLLDGSTRSLRQAGAFRPGDVIVFGPRSEKARVSRVVPEHEEAEILNPLTYSGYIIVDGVHASCHSVDHDRFQVATAPLRAMYNIHPRLLASRPVQWAIALFDRYVTPWLE